MNGTVTAYHLSIILLFSVCSYADTLFVAPNGDDSNNGRTRTQCMEHPEIATKKAQDGDVIFLQPGRYTLQQQIKLKKGVDLIGSGVAGDKKTVITADWTETEYTGSIGYYDSKYLVRIEDAGDQDVAHFVLDGNEWKVIGGIVTEGTDNLEVHNVHFVNFFFTCAWFRDGANLYVHNLNMRNSGYESDGYSAGHLNVGTIFDSRFEHIRIDAYHEPSGYGIKAMGSTPHWKRIVFSNLDIDIKSRAAWKGGTAPNICFEVHNATAEECEIRDSHFSGNLSLATQDRYKGPSYSLNIHHNVIECDSAYAFELSASRLEIHHNYLVNGGGIANWAGADKHLELDGISIHHNVVEGTKYGTFMYLKYAMTNFKCYNNVFISQESGRSVFKLDHNKVRTGWEVRNNIFLAPNLSLVQLNDGAKAPDMIFTHNFSRNMNSNTTLAEEYDNRIGEPDLTFSGEKPKPWYLPKRSGNLIDKGFDMGWAFEGDAPEIGAFELSGTTSVVLLSDNRTLKKSIQNGSQTMGTYFDLLGRNTMYLKRDWHSYNADKKLPAGVYFNKQTNRYIIMGGTNE